jgi:outer membrane immunogenic protein
MPGMHRFAVVWGGLFSVIAFSTASAADLSQRTYTEAPPAVVAPAYDWNGFYIGLNGGRASSQGCYAVTSIVGIAVVANSEGCQSATGDAATTDNRYFLSSRSYVSRCFDGATF